MLQHLLNGLQMRSHQPGSSRNIPRAKRRQELAALFGKPWCRGAAGSNLRVYKAHVNLGDRIHNHGNDLVSGRQGQQLVKLPRALDPIEQPAFARREFGALYIRFNGLEIRLPCVCAG